MNAQVFEITYLDLLICALLMLIPYAVSRWLRLGLDRDLLVGTIRVFVQLLLVGFILEWVFAINHPLPILGILLIMTANAGVHAAKRAGLPQTRIILTAIGVIGVSSFAVSAYVFYLVVGVTPYFNPMYVIPMMGISLNGAMNAIAIGARALDEGIRDGRERIEAALCVGATSWQASNYVVQRAIRQAMTPAINALMTAGIVQLPGVMTGQIIGGVDPVMAVRYQVVIFYMLASIVALSTIGGTLILSRGYFTSSHQLK